MKTSPCLESLLHQIGVVPLSAREYASSLAADFYTLEAIALALVTETYGTTAARLFFIAPQVLPEWVRLSDDPLFAACTTQGLKNASSGESVGDGWGQFSVSARNRRNFLQVESNELC